MTSKNYYDKLAKKQQSYSEKDLFGNNKQNQKSNLPDKKAF